MIFLRRRGQRTEADVRDQEQGYCQIRDQGHIAYHTPPSIANLDSLVNKIHIWSQNLKFESAEIV